MKKSKIILALLALLPISRAFAQQGEIIYRVFQPDYRVYIYSNDTVYLDFDQDNHPELVFYFEAHFPFYRIIDMTSSINDSTWMWGGRCTNDWASPYDTPLSDPAVVYTKYHGNWMGYYDENGHYQIDSIMHGIIKYSSDNGTCYGWFLANTNKTGKLYMAVKEMAFCTIPNYPLRWGQKSITGIDENESHHTSKLYPNPATGTVRIEGEKSIEVQVYNTLGQLVKTVQNTNEVSLEGMPQGIYLLRVTLENGQVFSDKVVKE